MVDANGVHKLTEADTGVTADPFAKIIFVISKICGRFRNGQPLRKMLLDPTDQARGLLSALERIGFVGAALADQLKQTD